MKNICAEQVYKSIFDEHAEHLRNFLVYKGCSVQRAEDIVQEAYIKLWENCSKVEVAKAKSYLFTVSNNIFLNEVKHQKVRLKFEDTVKNTNDNQSPQFLLEEKEFKLRLESAIKQLPDNQRIVFLMNRLDKKTYQEIAESLEVSVKTIEKRMHKALLALRKIHQKV